MIKETVDENGIPLSIPRVPVKITREGERLKIKIGRYQLRLKEIDGKSQTYDLVTLEQFITNSSKLVYENIIKNEQIKKDLMSLADGTESN